MADVRILAFAGSTRRDSLNRKLVQVAADAVKDVGGEVTLINLADFDLPIFDQDYEAEHGKPEGAIRLKQLFLEHNGLLISSPEYNSSISAVLKNAIDWVSRKDEGEPMKAAFLGKVAGLLAASPGGLGGIRGLVHLRSILQNIGIIVLPDQITLSEAHSAFDEDGGLTNERKQVSVQSLAAELVSTIGKLNT